MAGRHSAIPHTFVYACLYKEEEEEGQV